MGGGTYSTETRAMYSSSVAAKSTDEIFKQNKLRQIHKDMSPMDLGIREARDSDAHPESLAIIIALDVTGSMGRIPERIVKDDLTHIMETLIGAGLKDVQLMFLAIGDHHSDSEPLQVGQFESADQELAMWLERIWIERGGGGGATESYPLAWLVGGKHTSIDCLEKRSQKGFLFTIGDEACHPTYNPVHITGEPAQIPYQTKDLLESAKEKYNVYHIHVNYTGYRNNQHVLNQWKELVGQNLLMAEDDHEISVNIANAVKDSLNLSPVIDEVTSEKKAKCPECLKTVHQKELDIFGGICEECNDNPAPATDDKPSIML